MSLTTYTSPSLEDVMVKLTKFSPFWTLFGTILEKVSNFVIPNFYTKNVELHGVALDAVGEGGGQIDSKS